MADDRIDWEQEARDLLAAALEGFCLDLRPETAGIRLSSVHFAIAAALRAAHEVGMRESGRLYDEHSRALDRLLEQAGELATIRRELAARREVDGWLRENGDRYLEVSVLSGRLNACGGLMRLVASAPTYPALAAALGLEVEDE